VFVCVGSVTVFVFAGVVTVFVCVTVFVLAGAVTVVVGVVGGAVVVDFVCADSVAVGLLDGLASLLVCVAVGAVLPVPSAGPVLSSVAVRLTLLATLVAPPEPHPTSPNAHKPSAHMRRASPAPVLFQARLGITTSVAFGPASGAPGGLRCLPAGFWVCAMRLLLACSVRTAAIP